uniref:Uncharacterized protein n=1 Tax=Rhizophora mucronata TaxID=61149 RepID=A0A2P2IYH8_RHIMU
MSLFRLWYWGACACLRYEFGSFSKSCLVGT